MVLLVVFGIEKLVLPCEGRGGRRFCFSRRSFQQRSPRRSKSTLTLLIRSSRYLTSLDLPPLSSSLRSYLNIYHAFLVCFSSHYVRSSMYDDGMAVAKVYLGHDGCGAEHERAVGEKTGSQWYV